MGGQVAQLCVPGEQQERGEEPTEQDDRRGYIQAKLQAVLEGVSEKESHPLNSMEGKGSQQELPGEIKPLTHQPAFPYSTRSTSRSPGAWLQGRGREAALTGLKSSVVRPR